MSERPGDDSERNPFEEMLRQFGLAGDGSPADLQALLAKLQGEFSQFASQMGSFMAPAPEGQALNWDSTRNTARHVVAALGPDPSPDDRQKREVREAVELADSWLDAATDFPGGAQPRAWARAEWVEATLPTWRPLVEPIAAQMAEAMEGIARTGLAGPELGQFEAMLKPMIRRSAGAMFAANAGQSVGKLATLVVSGTDLGLPLLEAGTVALLPANVAAFAEGLDVPERDVRIYLALREAARQRLFGHVGWLRTQLLALVEHYAREITIDESVLSEAFGGMETMDPEGMQAAAEKLQGAIFQPATTAEQKAVLGRLEVLLALVEGWVDDVVGQVAGRWMPEAGALAETVRRRRATGGPAEKAAKGLLGLELHPKRVREAANLWAALRDARGADGRDDVWLHPDLIPTAADLDDPLGYVNGESTDAAEDDLDAELRKLLESEGDA